VRHVSIAGRLLVAAPVLTDPHFDRTVVLMLTHDLGGALGLVLNRMDPEIPSSALAPWVAHGPAPRSLYEGGPVQPDGLIGLMGVATARLDDMDHTDWFTTFLATGDRTVGTIDLGLGVDTVPEALRGDVHVRVFRGYSGWAPGQLDQELTRPGWLVADLEASDVFTDEPWHLWRRVLARQRGAAAWLARFPDDLSVN
jgi:putative transcriptional regulator